MFAKNNASYIVREHQRSLVRDLLLHLLCNMITLARLVSFAKPFQIYVDTSHFLQIATLVRGCEFYDAKVPSNNYIFAVRVYSYLSSIFAMCRS